LPFVSKMRGVRWAPAAMGDNRYALREIVKLDETDAQAAVPTTLSALAQIMWDEGLPQTGAKTAKEEAISLLQIAAEVEHALLVQYLYSAYSLNPNVQQAADAQLKIIEVAKQEMAHLITVQNILLALGTKVDLNRENFPKDPKDYPFPVVLEPLSSDALAKYVTTESPTIDKVAPGDRNDVIAIAQQADLAVSGTASKVNHVGVIYAKIYWLFQQGDAPEGPWVLDADVIECFVRSFGAGFHLKDGDFADPTTVNNFAATPTEWGVSDATMHVDSGTPRSKALAAIAWITAQGEGPNQSDIVESHFQTFLSLYRTFKAGLPNNAVLDIPINPSTDSNGTGAPSANSITDPITLRWAQVLNLRYQILLLDVVVGLGIDRSKEALLRGKIMHSWAVQTEMSGFLSTIAIALTSKKRTTVGTTSPVFAGAPFELDEIPDSPCEQWRKQKELAVKCAAIAGDLKSLLNAGDPDRDFLDSIVSFDQTRQSVIDQKIGELCHL
jgi:hypothetical protein